MARRGGQCLCAGVVGCVSAAAQLTLKRSSTRATGTMMNHPPKHRQPKSTGKQGNAEGHHRVAWSIRKGTAKRVEPPSRVTTHAARPALHAPLEDPSSECDAARGCSVYVILAPRLNCSSLPGLAPLASYDECKVVHRLESIQIIPHIARYF